MRLRCAPVSSMMPIFRPLMAPSTMSLLCSGRTGHSAILANLHSDGAAVQIPLAMAAPMTADAIRKVCSINLTFPSSSIHLDAGLFDERAIACAIDRLPPHEFLDCHWRDFATEPSHVIHQRR
jgi:hypothetical protein